MITVNQDMGKYRNKISKKSTVKITIGFGFDWPRYSVFFLISNQLFFFANLCLLFICVILYTFSEAIATECSTPQLAPHIYWFLCMRTGSRHGPWNSLLYIFVKPLEFSQPRLSNWHWILQPAMSRFHMPILINHRNNSKIAPTCLYFARLSSWVSLHQRYC